MYMLDTNTVSYIFRQNPTVLAKLKTVPPSKICISSITEAELRYGIAKRQNKALEKMVNTFIESVTVHEWDSEVAKIYGELRADMEKTGRVMGTMDQLIAAHAVSKGLVIVTNGAAFVMVNGLLVEDWTKEACR
ncbi:type II toxin-antitoxin system VapC family toxin [Xenorhabdus bovienii]|uniref:type II toxin-antitoxin system VapC family toxin n=1 Tax=Xenorhabdus bovienii TaxID=40576 RepID=UPI0023B2BD7A|nr:type II toxin-antitoxin system VapC family toxin [Xenorhabdus bovienii]MDE9533870.1 type II toxin-antitoxin system VapC family toxin [Xenorhabdus bovienii]MDE9586726.1 type II toxin-antitoxin system VapC family toxin [Xenorhabdus bovienii]